MKTSSTLFLILFELLFNSLKIYSQSPDKLYIDRFEKKDLKSIAHKSWNIYSDAKSGGGSKGVISYPHYPTTSVLRFSYSLLKKNWEYQPYVGLSCSPGENIFTEVPAIGIAYEFRGSKHTFNYLTNGVIDNAYYKKTIDESKDWKTIVIPFSELNQDSWTTEKTPFDYFDIKGLTWVINGFNGDSGSFEIDNLRFVLSPEKNNITFKNTPSPLKEDTIAKKIFTKFNDSIFSDTTAYTYHSTSYYTALKKIKSLEKSIDSLIIEIDQSSSLTDQRKLDFMNILRLTFNNNPRDILGSIKAINKKSQKILSKYVSTEELYKKDIEYWKQLNQLTTCNLWAKSIWNFSATHQIDYFTTPDSSFEKEIKKYAIRPGMTIAEIGAGSCFFEQALSLYCDNIKVYVNEIDKTRIIHISTKLKFLELYDEKNITYLAINGSDTATGLPEKSCDKIIIKNTFHHFTSPDKMLIDIKKALKTDGQLFITDIMRDEVDKVACTLHMKREEFMNYFINNGFILVNESPLGYGQDKCCEFRSEPGLH